MKDPEFLTLDEVLALHADQIARYGGSEGIRDVGLLESALAAPAATFDGGYLHSTLPEMAAAYLFHLVKNHPFIDGNERVGLAAAIACLGLNDRWLEAAPDALADLVVAVAAGRAGKPEITVFVKEPSVDLMRRGAGFEPDRGTKRKLVMALALLPFHQSLRAVAFDAMFDSMWTRFDPNRPPFWRHSGDGRRCLSLARLLRPRSPAPSRAGSARR